MTGTDIDEDRVREVAYHIWNSEGQPEGKATEHWFRALEALRPAAAPEPASKRKARKA